MLQNQHAFGIYKIAAQQSGATIVSAPDVDLAANVDSLLAHVTPRTKSADAGEPEQPDRDVSQRRGSEAPASQACRHVLLGGRCGLRRVCRASSDYSPGIDLASTAPNVLMTRTFSKIYGLAALRLGWAYGPADVIDALNRVRGPSTSRRPPSRRASRRSATTNSRGMSAAHNRTELARVTRELNTMGLKTTPERRQLRAGAFRAGSGGRRRRAPALARLHPAAHERLRPAGRAALLHRLDRTKHRRARGARRNSCLHDGPSLRSHRHHRHRPDRLLDRARGSDAQRRRGEVRLYDADAQVREIAAELGWAQCSTILPKP